MICPFVKVIYMIVTLKDIFFGGEGLFGSVVSAVKNEAD